MPIFRTIPYDHHHAITLIPGHSTQHKFRQIKERMLEQFQEHDADDGNREEEEEGGYCGCLLIALY